MAVLRARSDHRERARADQHHQHGPHCQEPGRYAAHRHQLSVYQARWKPASPGARELVVGGDFGGCGKYWVSVVTYTGSVGPPGRPARRRVPDPAGEQRFRGSAPPMAEAVSIRCAPSTYRFSVCGVLAEARQAHRVDQVCRWRTSGSGDPAGRQGSGRLIGSQPDRHVLPLLLDVGRSSVASAGGSWKPLPSASRAAPSDPSGEAGHVERAEALPADHFDGRLRRRIRRSVTHAAALGERPVAVPWARSTSGCGAPARTICIQLVEEVAVAELHRRPARHRHDSRRLRRVPVDREPHDDLLGVPVPAHRRRLLASRSTAARSAAPSPRSHRAMGVPLLFKSLRGAPPASPVAAPPAPMPPAAPAASVCDRPACPRTPC